MQNIESLAKNLRDYHIDAEQVIPLVNFVEHDPIILFVGSLHQRLGTPTSDVDFLVVYPAGCSIKGVLQSSASYKTEVDILKEGDASFPTEYSLVLNRRSPGNYKVQFTVTTAEKIRDIQTATTQRNQSIARRLEGDFSERQRQGKMLDRASQALIHRFYTGLPLQNIPALNSLKDQTPYQVFIDNIGIRETSDLRSWISDLEGLRTLNTPYHRETLIFIAQRLLMNVGALALSSVGELAPQEKLLFRLLGRYREHIGERVIDAIIERFSDVGAWVDRGPDALINFVSELPEQLSGLSAFVKNEISDWAAESKFNKFSE